MPENKPLRLSYTFLLCCLVIIGFAARLYMAHLDPFLHIWDERFHALVARNMMDFPFMPMLRIHPAIPPPNPVSWTQGSLWLHKQPLFMWQMALSMKLFGVNVYALRYPSVLMGTLMIPMVYHCIKIISNNRNIALLTAAYFCFSSFHLNLVGGLTSMDHNDLTLEFYVLASVWAWLQYEKSRKWPWLILVGICSGGAVLTKWLVGLFVFLIWGIKILLQFKRSFDIKEVIAFMLALTLCCIVFLPWQFYIINHFPIEAAYEYAFNKRHITEALEGHDGTIFYYLGRFPQMFGEGIFLFIFPGIYLWYKHKDKNAVLAIPVLLATLLVFLFFSLIVKTKTVSHFYFVAPFVILFMAYSMLFIVKRYLKNRYLLALFFIGVFVLATKPEKIIMDQRSSNEERNDNIYNALIYQVSGKNIPPGSVVVNVQDWVSFMFFNKPLVAYENFSEEQINDLKKRKIELYAFDHVHNHPLPDYIKSYPYLHLIHQELR